jgi:hypothetical protein
MPQSLGHALGWTHAGLHAGLHAGAPSKPPVMGQQLGPGFIVCRPSKRVSAIYSRSAVYESLNPFGVIGCMHAWEGSP